MGFLSHKRPSKPKAQSASVASGSEAAFRCASSRRRFGGNPAIRGCLKLDGPACSSAGSCHDYPVKYVLWRKKEGGAFETDLALEDVFRAVERYELSASPVESADKTSPWLSLPARAHIGLSKVLGKSPYTAGAGLVTWADGIYWARVVEKRPDGLLLVENLHDAGKREVECVKHPIEPEFLYPFVRWDRIRKWHARPSCYVILPHTLETGWRPVEPSLMKEVAPTHSPT